MSLSSGDAIRENNSQINRAQKWRGFARDRTKRISMSVMRIHWFDAKSSIIHNCEVIDRLESSFIRCWFEEENTVRIWRRSWHSSSVSSTLIRSLKNCWLITRIRRIIFYPFVFWAVRRFDSHRCWSSTSLKFDSFQALPFFSPGSSWTFRRILF